MKLRDAIKWLMIGASLSESHTSVTALQDTCVCLVACGFIYQNLHWTNGNEGTCTFQICTRAKVVLCNGSQQRTPHCATQCRWVCWVWEIDYIWSDTAAPAPKRTGRKARLDRRCVHSEESVTFSGSISVELHSDGSIMSTCTEH